MKYQICRLVIFHMLLNLLTISFMAFTEKVLAAIDSEKAELRQRYCLINAESFS